MKHLLIFVISIICYNSKLAAQQNNLSLLLGTGGGDNISESYIYGLEYGHRLNPTIEIFGKYVQSNQSFNDGVIDQGDLIEKNTADDPHSSFNQFYSIGMGAHIHIVKTVKSTLFLTAGARYVNSQRMDPFSLFSGIVEGVKMAQNNGIDYEFGIGYRRQLGDKFLISGRLNYLNFETRFSGVLLVGMRF